MDRSERRILWPLSADGVGGDAIRCRGLLPPLSNRHANQIRGLGDAVNPTMVIPTSTDSALPQVWAFDPCQVRQFTTGQ